MRELRFDSVGGASGDMILGALLELSDRRDELVDVLRSLLPNERFEIVSESVVERGVAALRTTVEIGTSEEKGRGVETNENHHHHGGHRDFASIKSLLENSQLPASVKALSVAVFARLAEAEGKIHGKPADQVHFHEVGAVDSIIDVVGACYLLWTLNIDRVRLSPLPVGQGTLTCEHGVMPIPAPATMELLKGLPIVQTDEPFELVTPTAAAILSTWVAESGDSPSNNRVIRDCVHSAGQRRLNGRGNLLRASILEVRGEELPWDADQCVVLETTIDDATPELMGALRDKLMAAGALDVFIIPAQMKKCRPGFALTVLCREDLQDDLTALLFREGTTFGIRRRLADRATLPREIVKTSTPFGPIDVKIGRLGGDVVVVSPEFDDCVKAAAGNDAPVKTVYEAARESARRGLRRSTESF